MLLFEGVCFEEGMLCVHVVCACCVCMLCVHTVCACCVCMLCVHVVCACCVFIICMCFLEGAYHAVSACSSEWFCRCFCTLHYELIAWWGSQTSTPLNGWLSLDMGILFCKGQVGPMISMSWSFCWGLPGGSAYHHSGKRCTSAVQNVGFNYLWNHFTRLSLKEDSDSASQVISRWCHAVCT